MKQLQSDVPIFEVRFHSCCHGGERDKGTMFWTNVRWFNPLALLCDGSHPHKPWTTVARNKRLTFETASKAAYPFVLVQRMAAIVKQIDALDLQAQSDKPHHSLHRVVMGAFPRGKRLKPLLADFGDYRTVLCAAQNTQPLDKHLESMPKGAAIVRRHILERGEVERACSGGALLLAEHGSFGQRSSVSRRQGVGAQCSRRRRSGSWRSPPAGSLPTVRPRSSACWSAPEMLSRIWRP